jgi:glucan 1,3-beta-glucosidase
MRSLLAFLLSAFVLEAACMQLPIPIVESIVADILSTNEDYVQFHGNNTNLTSVTTSSSTNLFKRQATAYWYENINHQGISAFGPSGYQVFRNVKSYGAKGITNILHRGRR